MISSYTKKHTKGCLRDFLLSKFPKFRRATVASRCRGESFIWLWEDDKTCKSLGSCRGSTMQYFVGGGFWRYRGTKGCYEFWDLIGG